MAETQSKTTADALAGVLKAARSGAARSMAAYPGTIPDLLSFISELTGLDMSLDTELPGWLFEDGKPRQFKAQKSDEIIKAASENLPALSPILNYDPENVAERYAQTGMEYAAGPIATNFATNLARSGSKLASRFLPRQASDKDALLAYSRLPGDAPTAVGSAVRNTAGEMGRALLSASPFGSTAAALATTGGVADQTLREMGAAEWGPVAGVAVPLAAVLGKSAAGQLGRLPSSEDFVAQQIPKDTGTGSVDVLAITQAQELMRQGKQIGVDISGAEATKAITGDVSLQEAVSQANATGLTPTNREIAMARVARATPASGQMQVVPGQMEVAARRQIEQLTGQPSANEAAIPGSAAALVKDALNRGERELLNVPRGRGGQRPQPGLFEEVARDNVSVSPNAVRSIQGMLDDIVAREGPTDIGRAAEEFRGKLIQGGRYPTASRLHSLYKDYNVRLADELGRKENFATALEGQMRPVLNAVRDAFTRADPRMKLAMDVEAFVRPEFGMADLGGDVGLPTFPPSSIERRVSQTASSNAARNVSDEVFNFITPMRESGIGSATSGIGSATTPNYNAQDVKRLFDIILDGPDEVVRTVFSALQQRDPSLASQLNVQAGVPGNPNFTPDIRQLVARRLIGQTFERVLNSAFSPAGADAGAGQAKAGAAFANKLSATKQQRDVLQELVRQASRASGTDFDTQWNGMQKLISILKATEAVDTRGTGSPTQPRQQRREAAEQAASPAKRAEMLSRPRQYLVSMTTGISADRLISAVAEASATPEGLEILKKLGTKAGRGESGYRLAAELLDLGRVAVAQTQDEDVQRANAHREITQMKDQ